MPWRTISSRIPPAALLLVCAGTGEEFSLEDAFAAGALVTRLSDDQRLSDSAMITRSLYEQVGDDLDEWLRQTQNGRHLRKIGKDADITWCARLSVFDLVCPTQRERRSFVRRSERPMGGPIRSPLLLIT